MKAKSSFKLTVPAAMLLTAFCAHAADPATTGEVTVKGYLFDYSGGPGADRNHFLERYNSQKAMGGDDPRSGFYLDADVDLRYGTYERTIFSFERSGFGRFNNRNALRYDRDGFGLSARYSEFRTATGGLGYLYNPNLVPGGTDPLYTNASSGYVGQFNDDSGRSLYTIDRTTWGMSANLKPAMLGGMASVQIGVDGYKRKGNLFTPYVLGGSDLLPNTGLARAQQRWRALDQRVDENMNRLSFRIAASPADAFQASYDFAVEKFDNGARAFTFADVSVPGYTVAPDLTRPLGFTPDSTLVTHGLRFAKSFGRVALAAGYGRSTLEQDTFTQPQQAAGYTTGKISTDSAYLTASGRFASGIGLEGFVRYHNRDNNSTFPAGSYLNTIDGERLGVRINSIETLSYGLAASFRPSALKSTITVGWKHEDKDRSLTFHESSTVPPINGISQDRSLYRADSSSDELYLRLIARPMQGMTLRITPSYLTADKTGLIAEPEEALGLKARLSYAVSASTVVTGMYDYKNRKNANNSFIGTDGSSVKQDTDKTFQSAGVSLSMAPTQWVNTNVGLHWFQDDFESYYFGTNRRRFEGPNNPVIFAIRDRSNYKIDSWMFTLGGNWQVTDALRLDGSYTYSKSRGNTASGQILAELPAIDGRIDNSVQSVALGLDYEFAKNRKLRAAYFYDRYSDSSYSALSGNVNTLMLGVSIGF